MLFQYSRYTSNHYLNNTVSCLGHEIITIAIIRSTHAIFYDIKVIPSQRSSNNIIHNLNNITQPIYNTFLSSRSIRYNATLSTTIKIALCDSFVEFCKHSTINQSNNNIFSTNIDTICHPNNTQPLF